MCIPFLTALALLGGDVGCAHLQQNLLSEQDSIAWDPGLCLGKGKYHTDLFSTDCYFIKSHSVFIETYFCINCTQHFGVFCSVSLMGMGKSKLTWVDCSNNPNSVMFQVCPVPPHSNASYTGNDILKHLAARTDMLKYVYKESNLWNSFNLKF